MSIFRRPKGSYLRNTPDWFVDRQAFASSFQQKMAGAPFVVGSNSAQSNTCPMPAGVQVGDMIFFACAEGTSSLPPTVGTWNHLNTSPGSNRVDIYWKYAQAGDPSSFTSGTTQSAPSSGIIVVRGGATSGLTPFDVTAQGSGTGSTLTATSITAAANNELYLLWFGTDGANINGGAPTGMTQQVLVANTGAGHYPIAGYSQSVNSGATGTRVTSDDGTTNNWNFVQVLIPVGPPNLYANLYNNATDGSVLYVTDLQIFLDVADLLVVQMAQGADINPFTSPNGVFGTRPGSLAPPGILYQQLGSSVTQGTILSTPPGVVNYQFAPAEGSYVCVLPPGYGLVTTNTGTTATKMATKYDYIWLPN